MAKEKIPRQKMPKQDPKKRARNFSEVAKGFSEEAAVSEASRCIQCKNAPCKAGCPVEIDIPGFLKLVAERDFEGAIKLIKQKNDLPAICGRVCPQETQCEPVCTLGKKEKPVAIGALERFVADKEFKKDLAVSGKRLDKTDVIAKVAVVGSGPAGLTCAADLARIGYDVTIFESLHAPGGVLRYGIPEFRLPKDIVDREIDYIKRLGVEIKVNVLIGRTLTIEDLFKKGYKAIFIGTGAGLPNFLGIPGENLNGIYSANEFLTRANLMHGYQFPKYDTPVRVGKKTVVMGAGNTAMDAVRCALRLGAEEASIVYRRSDAEMPARKEEIENAKEEGIRFYLLTNPIRFIADDKGWVKQMECIKMRLGEPDASGRRRPVPIEGSNFIMDVDTAIIAIGQAPNPLLPKLTRDLKTDEYGAIIVDKDGMTSIKGIFAGGDITTGEGTVIEAMGAGKKCSASIVRYIKQNLVI